MANAYPLEWPSGWKRTAPHARKNGQFNKKTTQYSGSSSYQRKQWLTVADGVSRIIGALGTMGATSLVISTNVPLKLNGQPRSGEREPDDPGAAIYWSKGKQPQRCMAIDRYTTVADNLAAIAATLDAMRAIERHGGAEILERSFSGFNALPAKASQPWREVLGFGPGMSVSREYIESQFRSLARRHHPDQGGDREQFELIVKARTDALNEISA